MLNTSSSFETLGDLDGWLRSLEISTPWASVVRDKIKLVSSDRPGYSRKSGRLTAGTPSRRTARVTTFGRLCTADLDRLFPSFTTYYRVLSCPETLWGSLALIPATSFTQYGLRHVEWEQGSALPGLREDSTGDQALLVCSLQASVILRASSVAHQPDSTPDSGIPPFLRAKNARRQIGRAIRRFVTAKSEYRTVFNTLPMLLLARLNGRLTRSR
jgi:hypothetical protein